ncbi:hypothetical protein RDV89_00930 [Nocardioides zeae]|uniref:CHAT domain-containing protein n=1 Tax=Nocardioides imazamoxiresistens TaxID=3231893 RepID=A0ABU3PQV5_9ACTN|nr:hypothetical protein [Nocardioides zeae]MDT9591610.1 hypothetical protein [Nocardioides zeae]
MAANGIFCLEGEWDTDLRRRHSVEPVLEFLERMRETRYVHRDVATTTELAYYLDQWGQARYDDYQVLFLATHGDLGTLSWSRKHTTSLADLADLMPSNTQHCYVYLGSCLTLFAEAEAKKFVARTGVSALMGYREEVGFISGAAFELILLSYVANHRSYPKRLFDDLMATHGGLARLHDFTMVTRRSVLSSKDHP